jgi:glycosyltransferase involved in cell wall biosynthesis
VANVPLQQRYGGTVIPHARDPQQLRPATPAEKFASRHYFGVPLVAKVVLFFGTPKRHKGLLSLARAVAQLPQSLYPQLVVVGVFAPEDRDLQQELEMLLPQGRLRLLGDQPFEQAPRVLALADLVVLLGEGDVAAFQSPAKLSDALAMGLPVAASPLASYKEFSEFFVDLEAGGLSELASAPARFHDMVVRAQQAVLPDYLAPSMQMRWLDCLGALIKT